MSVCGDSLELRSVSKGFVRAGSDDVTYAIENVSLKAHVGEFLSIVGPSGCGKSTIMRLIAGLIVPTSGEITLNGKAIEGTSPERGMVFQRPTLFQWLTVEQNLLFGPKVMGCEAGSKEHARELLELAGLWEFKDDYPHQLSGGMAQRLALIRTMISYPTIFLLDEPLGALDAFTRMNMQDEILKLWDREHQIMMMVTHDIDEAIYMGTRIVVMEPRPGRIRSDIKNDMPYPRNRASDRFLEYRKQILKMLDFGTSDK